MEKDSPEKEARRIDGDVKSVINENRILAFSDAIFAFAATLLVLKIDFPVLEPTVIRTELVNELINLWPTYFANILSFMIIGYYWLSHHAIFNLVRRYNHTLIWLNIVLLISVSFLPFPVELFGDFSSIPIVVAFYSLNIALVGLLLFIIWWYASYNCRLIDKNTSKKEINYYLLLNAIAPVIFLLSIPLAFVDVSLAKFAWVGVIVAWIVLNHFYKYQNKPTSIEKASL